MEDPQSHAPEEGPVRSPDRFLVFGAPQIAQAEIDEVVDSMDSAWLGTGPKVAEFEDAFARFKGSGHAVAVNSCTAALHLSLLAAGVGHGDEVITPALTFAATVNAIIHSGATPVLADVDPDTQNIDPDDVAARITDRTRVIMPVHFAGRPAPMDRLLEVASRHGLELIEDCAHAVESEYRGRPTGSFGRFGCFSFYATKNVTCGEGGMVLSRDASDADRLKVLALHGMSRDAWRRFGDSGYRHYRVIEAGYKYNMMDLQAAIGIHQLDRVAANWRKRAELWDFYMEQLESTTLALPAAPEPDTKHGYHLFTVFVNEQRSGIDRDTFLDSMTRQGIGVGVHYLSLPEHPYYQERFGWHPDAYPQSKRLGRQTVSLPLSPRLNEEDAADVVEAVRRSLGDAV